MRQIAESEVAINHPVNLYQFVELYGPYAQIRFVVLHRPFLDTVASHMDWDGGWEGHSHLIRGFMVLLRRFLDERGVDSVSGGNLWTIVCVERLMSKFYQYQGEHGSQVDYEEWDLGRRRILSYLADFLGWSQRECDDCFASWRERSNDKISLLESDKIMPLLDHMKEIEGIWPPMLLKSFPEQRCST